ncbi:MAG: hypothetical protein K9H25_16260 [Rhodospirillum sp.]|nr:hypothetical protein [Rhodospirillum sp.]MCF8489640.1 hypothetical protein [Rhodospirillum sp.]MCF8500556.1 hypothetical protein [Rhodospirillum sp.]
MPVRAQTICRNMTGGTQDLDLTPTLAGGRMPHVDGTLYVEGTFDGASVGVLVRGITAWHHVEGSPFLAGSVARVDAHVLGIRVALEGEGPGTDVSVALLCDLIPLVGETA